MSDLIWKYNHKAWNLALNILGKHLTPAMIDALSLDLAALAVERWGKDPLQTCLGRHHLAVSA